MPGASHSQDPFVAALLGASDPKARESRLQEIVDDEVAPLAHRLLAAEIERGALSPSEAEDLQAEVVLRLVRKLRQVLHDPETNGIESLRDYVSTATYNALDDLKRRRDPVRGRLASRLRYVLTHSSNLSLWEGDGPICGLATWEGRHDVVRVDVPRGSVSSVPEDAEHLRTAVEETFRKAGGPVAFGALVDAFASTMGLPEEPFVGVELLSERGVPPDTQSRLEAREYLERLWREIAVLPVRQRKALLLQLRLEDGESAARVLAALGIVPLRSLAEGLDLPLTDLLALWNDLPLSDDRIARMLGVVRQKVINLRKSARDRLARRMARPR